MYKQNLTTGKFTSKYSISACRDEMFCIILISPRRDDLRSTRASDDRWFIPRSKPGKWRVSVVSSVVSKIKNWEFSTYL